MSRSLSRAVLDAVAANEGREVTNLEEPLYEAIDPEALDELFRSGSGRVIFEYAGYEVTVESSGDVTVTPLSAN